jgi:hypothetical protein
MRAQKDIWYFVSSLSGIRNGYRFFVAVFEVMLISTP